MSCHAMIATTSATSKPVPTQREVTVSSGRQLPTATSGPMIHSTASAASSSSPISVQRLKKKPRILRMKGRWKGRWKDR